MSRETIKELHDVKCPYCDKEFVLSTCTYPTLIDWTMRREQIEEVRTATIEEISKLDLPDQTKETYRKVYFREGKTRTKSVREFRRQIPSCKIFRQKKHTRTS